MGADGFGRSDDVPSLREFFEVNAKYIVRTVITSLVQQGQLKNGAMKKLNDLYKFDPDKVNPAAFH